MMIFAASLPTARSSRGRFLSSFRSRRDSSLSPSTRIASGAGTVSPPFRGRLALCLFFLDFASLRAAPVEHLPLDELGGRHSPFELADGHVQAFGERERELALRVRRESFWPPPSPRSYPSWTAA